jgi:hypothetical protein
MLIIHRISRDDADVLPEGAGESPWSPASPCASK